CRHADSTKRCPSLGNEDPGVAMVSAARWRADAASRTEQFPHELSSRIILSFDIEEHFRIEAAVGLTVAPALRDHYRRRLDTSTCGPRGELARHDIKATFFVVGEIARDNPELVRAIHRAGHEVASHSWSHRRVHQLTPEQFREDVRQSKDALEQV